MHLPADPEALTGTDPLAAAAAALPDGAEIKWDWDVEHADRKREAHVDAAHGAQPFPVDRRVLRDIVKEKMGAEVGRIQFLNAGTFNKAYLVTLITGRTLVARISRRFMPRLKTASEVATMAFLRTHTSIPVPDVFHYDANPYNRLGGEYILMSKAPGIPLARVYHSLSHAQLLRLMDNTAALVIPLFAHRFPAIGSLYAGPAPSPAAATSAQVSIAAANGLLAAPDTPTPESSAQTPRASWLTPRPPSVFPPSSTAPAHGQTGDVHVGPIVSWPFFGSGRGDLRHPDELDRGPWASTRAYLQSCVRREVGGVIRENEGKSAPHRLHLDPDEVLSSRHHQLRAVEGDASDESTEWDWEESECDFDGGLAAGGRMYEDYRRGLRSTFLFTELAAREREVRREMARWMRVMGRLGAFAGSADAADAEGEQQQEGEEEEFALDPHDLNLENVFVDPDDPTVITCIIDWESTTTRPIWAAAHLPAFLQSSPFTAKLFRHAVARVAADPARWGARAGSAQEWLDAEARGARLRAAHRCVEWDGWEEGLVASILGPEEQEEEWFRAWEVLSPDADAEEEEEEEAGLREDAGEDESPESTSGPSEPRSEDPARRAAPPNAGRKQGAPRARPDERERERVLNATGDTCGGRGGELGRRLEAWLYSVGAEGERGVVLAEGEGAG